MRARCGRGAYHPECQETQIKLGAERAGSVKKVPFKKKISRESVVAGCTPPAPLRECEFVGGWVYACFRRARASGALARRLAYWPVKTRCDSKGSDSGGREGGRVRGKACAEMIREERARFGKKLVGQMK